MLFLYTYLFGSKTVFTRIAHIFVALTSTFAVAGVIEGLAKCIPLAKAWNHELPGKCDNSIAVLWGFAIWNFLLDIGILTMPLPVLWNLQMSLSKKIGLTCMFAIGVTFVYTS